MVAVTPLYPRGKSPQPSYGLGLSVSVPAPEAEVLQAVQEVVADGIIQGSKEYNKDEYIFGADAADDSPIFPKWTGPGKVFFKVRQNAIDPRNFKDTTDAGTLAVRYVVQSGEGKSTILKIDAIFVDDLHHRSHPSDGSVEGAEYAAIQEHLATMHLQKRAAENEERMQHEIAAKELQEKRKEKARDQEIAAATFRPADESLDQHVLKLRRSVERIVKASGGRLRSAPFQSASSLQSLRPGSQVIILISTPYWFGVETENGHHGWVHRSQLEPLP
jgi:hypothetical protein